MKNLRKNEDFSAFFCAVRFVPRFVSVFRFASFCFAALAILKILAVDMHRRCAVFRCRRPRPAAKRCIFAATVIQQFARSGQYCREMRGLRLFRCAKCAFAASAISLREMRLRCLPVSPPAQYGRLAALCSRLRCEHTRGASAAMFSAALQAALRAYAALFRYFAHGGINPNTELSRAYGGLNAKLRFQTANTVDRCPRAHSSA